MMATHLQFFKLFQLTHGLNDSRTKKNEPYNDIKVRISDNPFQGLHNR